jgi:hypothetical protein
MRRPGVATLLVRTTGLLVLVIRTSGIFSHEGGENAIARNGGGEVGADSNNYRCQSIRVDVIAMATAYWAREV